MAIFLVVFNHLMLVAKPVLGRPLTFGYFGVWGVNCFFVLSGMLLGSSYLNALLTGADLPDLRAFYYRRFLRIYPLYAFALIVSILSASYFSSRWPKTGDVLAHVFLAQGLWKETALSLNPPMWTMGIDAAFYLVLPIFAAAIRPLLLNRNHRTRVIIITSALASVSVAGVVFRFQAYHAHPDSYFDFPEAVVDVRNLFGFACSFALGIGVALLRICGPAVGRPAAMLLGLVGVCIALFELLGRFEANVQPAFQALLEHSLLDPLAALSVALILVAASNVKSTSFETAASGRMLIFLANLAYAIYLFHWLAIVLVESLVVHNKAGLGVKSHFCCKFRFVDRVLS